MNANSANTPSFLAGGGELGELTRQHDWSTTSLGTPDQWPLSLRITVGLVLHSAFPMFVFWGPDRICFYNDAYRASLGTDGKHPAVGKPGAEVWPETWSFIGPMIDQVMTTGEPTFFEDQLVPIYRNGRLEDVYWTYSYSPAYSDDGRINGVFVTCTETTRKVNSISQLQVSEQRFQNLVRDASVGIIVLEGEDLRVGVVNDAYARLIGRSPQELKGNRLFSIIPEAEAVFRPIIDKVRHTGEPLYLYAQPYFVLVNGGRKDGFLDLVYQPYKEPDGQITGVMVLCQDVTEQVLARRKIEESETRFKSLIYEAPVATSLLVGPELRIDVANDIILGYWGKTKAVLGLPLALALPEIDGQPFLDILAEAYRSGEPYVALAAPANLEVNGVLGTYYFDFSYKPLRDSSGAVYAIMNMAVDVTRQVIARQKLEESEARYRTLSAQLEIQVQKRTEELAAANEELTSINEELATTNEELTASNEETIAANEHLSTSNNLLTRSNDNLEKFAYVASHDLQEPLRKIQSFGDLLKSQYAVQLGDGVEHLERMQAAASRMSTLIRDLLTFSRVATQREAISPVPLNEVLTQVLTDLDLRIQETGATVTVEPLPTVLGDRSQLEQLFLNLVSNALKFQRPGVPPVIQVSSRVLLYNELPPAAKPTRQAQFYSCIDVADNGIGFNEKYLDRIFQVFQRLNSKNQYAGTGIGLAISERVVANHGGAITASSQPGQGATFSVCLPQ